MIRLLLVLTIGLSNVVWSSDTLPSKSAENSEYMSGLSVVDKSVKLVQEKLIRKGNFVIQTNKRKYTLTKDIQVLDVRNDKSDYTNAIAVLSYRNGKLFLIELF